jgi:hypothetical protein
MSSDVFKVKKARETTSNKSKDPMGTLDSLHEKYIEELQQKTSANNIQTMITERDTINRRLEKPFDPFQFEDVMERSKLSKRLVALEETIKSATENTDIQSYYLESGDIMLDYYAQTIKKTVTKIECGTFDKLFSATETAIGPSKKRMFDEYLARRGLSNGLNVAENAEYIKKMAEHCATCNIPREEITAEGILVCPSVAPKSILWWSLISQVSGILRKSATTMRTRSRIT